jgi:hypothetical protein
MGQNRSLNPWLTMSKKWPWVAQIDEKRFEDDRLRRIFHVEEIPPMPWAGNPRKAPVILLATNPAWRKPTQDEIEQGAIQSHETIQNVARADMFLHAARFENDTFFPLHFPHSRWPGWLHCLHDDCGGWGPVYNHLAVVQYFPYRCVMAEVKQIPTYDDSLPSQRFTFDMMNDILEARNDVLIVVQRRFREWDDAIWRASGRVRRLYGHPRVVEAKRNAHISQAVSPNMYPDGGYQRIVKALRRAVAQP